MKNFWALTAAVLLAAASPLRAQSTVDLVAARSPIPTGASTTVAATAPGAAAYVWSASGGTITGSGATVTWQAPAGAGAYTISCQANGASASLQIAAVADALLWPSTPPAGCPFPASDAIPGIVFARFNSYHFADTWYPSWAADGELYSPWMDGILLGEPYNGNLSANAVEPSQGWAKITGDDCMNLGFPEADKIRAGVGSYGGRYAAGSLHYNGVWYYGTYTTMNENNSNDGFVTIDGVRYNWGVLGPLVGFHTSTDNGHTWTAPPQTPESPLFGEPAQRGGKVKIGIPHFVDFGRNMQHSPDGKAYLVCHGAMDNDPMPRLANVSWITGDQIFMIRVTPTLANINDPSKYEFFAGRDAGGAAIWTSNFSQIQPLIDWNNNCGNVSMTYNPGLGRYLLSITDGVTTAMKMNSYILESTSLTGPFKLVTYLAGFGEQAYFLNFPTKFLSSDGGKGWMWYSANFVNISGTAYVTENPTGSGYHLCMRETYFQQPVRSNGSGSPTPTPTPTPPPPAPPPPPPPAPAPAPTPAPAAPPREKKQYAYTMQRCTGSVAADASPGAWIPLLASGLLLLAAARRR